MRIRIIVNPISGRGRARRLAGDVARRFTDAGHAVEVLETARRGDATAWAAAESFDLIVACGGDGTVNEVLNGLPHDRQLMILPAGTGNVLAKEFRIGRTASAAERVLCTGRVRRIDLGRVNGRRFAFTMSAGLDAEVTRRVAALRVSKWSVWAYVPILIEALRSADNFAIDVEADGVRITRDARYVAVANIGSYGGPLRLLESAPPDDGWLDVVVLRKPLRGRLFRVLFAMFTRGLDRLPDAIRVRARRVSIRAEGEVPWQADGDFGGMLPADVEVEVGSCPLLLAAPDPKATPDSKPP